MSVDVRQPSPSQAESAKHASRPVAIEVQGLDKTFRIPRQRVDSIKERVLTVSNRDYRELHALDDVSFEIRQGEFFGVVGRNGSGKSTLLKILASIYAADSGRVRMAGRPAPFIELGVGFNQEMTALANIELNGVMMGLSREEARKRTAAILEFAELEDFVDMKLKNYSSGMMVRLAFTMMIQSDADILLIDEVLAVGDAAFQQKCADVFHDMRASDRTVVLVTHDMSAVEQYCDRALLLHNGRVQIIGDPEEVAHRYLKLNFETGASTAGPGGGEDSDAQLVDAWIEGPDGIRTGSLEQTVPVTVHAVFEAKRDIEGPSFGFTLVNADGVDVFGFGQVLDATPYSDEDVLAAGKRAHVSATIANQLATGRYVIKAWIHRHHNYTNPVLHLPHMLDFLIYGPHRVAGVVALPFEGKIVTEDGEGQ